MHDLEGKVAIVTGGAVGIGRTYAAALRNAGAKVAIFDIAAPSDDDAAGSLSHYQPIDVSDERQVERGVANVVEWAGGVDILVNNAALFASLHNDPIATLDADLWDKVMAVNLRGPFLMAKHCVDPMRARGGGKIVNIGSGSASKGMPFMAHYVTSKAGILGLTRTLSRELGKDNICVNTLSPGLIMSESIAENTEHLETNRERVLQSRALARDGYPEDLIGALLFLCSSQSDFVSGQTLAVDGGSVNL
ncbi:MAG: SDR family oxidoreductase [Pacificimonas sp.]|nr:SDR family oxidoreductase [Pacificimonas sp.]